MIATPSLFQRLQNPVEDAQTIIQDAIAFFRPAKVYALFSGGHDSLCASHLVSAVPGFAGCVHINTGIGIPATTEYVRQTCAFYGWPLQEFTSSISYEHLVLTYGFPGPSMHRVMYHALKERCLRQLFQKEHLSTVCRDCHPLPHHRRMGHAKNAACLLLVSGVRSEESARRMGYATASRREGQRVWVNPLLTWTSSERNSYIAAQGLPQNPVVQKLCMSGECLCGAFAHEGEMQELERFYPDVAAHIHTLEAKARQRGKACVWGQRPGTRGQQDSRQEVFPGLCWSCVNKLEEPPDGTSSAL